MTCHLTIEQLDLIDIFRTLHPPKKQNTHSSAHGTFSMIDHVLGHKTSLNKFKSTEIISSMFSDHNGMKLEINHRKKVTGRLSTLLLTNQWVNNEIKEEIKNTSWQMTMRKPPYKIYGMHQRQFLQGSS